MNLTGKEMVQKGIIIGPINEQNIQPNSVDLNVILIQEVTSAGTIGTHGTSVQPRTKVETRLADDEDTRIWFLKPGVYEAQFLQGCDIPADQRLMMIHRSSLVRNGTLITSGIFDSGFKSDNMGAILYVHLPLVIQVGARIATAYCVGSNIPDQLYNGQWVGYDEKVIKDKLPAK